MEALCEDNADFGMRSAEYIIPSSWFVYLPQAGISDWNGNWRVRSLNAPFKGVIACLREAASAKAGGSRATKFSPN